MAIEPQTRQIGEHTYTVLPMTAKKGTRALARLLKSPDPTEWDEKDRDYFEALFLPNTTVSGGSYIGDLDLGGLYELHFVDRYFEYLEWLAFCIQVNWKSFFEKANATMKAKSAARSAGE